MKIENSFAGGRVLVVEDDLLVVMDLVNTLHAMGAEVSGPIDNVSAAIDRLDKLDGIVGAVLDVNVQGEAIFPLADRLSDRGIPFVFATGYDDSKVPSEYAGAATFQKPADEQQIADALLQQLKS